MEFLQELFLTACMAVVLSLIVAVSITFSGGEGKTSGLVVDKRLKVVGAKIKKKVRFVDYAVAKDVEEDLDFMEKFDAILAKSLEEEILRDDVNIVKMLDEFEYDEKAELMVSGGKLVEEVGNVNLVMEVDPIDEKRIKEEKLGYANVFECNDIEENSLVDGRLEMKREEIDSRTGLEMVDDDVSINQKGIEVEGKDANSAVLLSETLDIRADDISIDEKGIEVGGKDADNAVLLGETLEIRVVEEKAQITDVNFDTDGGLENFSIEDISRTQPLEGESEVGRLNDGAIYENNVVGIKEDLGKANMVDEATVQDDEFEEEKEGSSDNMDDDWEGIERTELEKVFAEAVNYVEYGGKGKDDQLTNLGSDVQIQLFGLHKLAVEGPCYEPQPMALKVSARAKWNSWQRLGSMSPELAMEQYIKLLSETDPEWAYHPDAGDGKDAFIQSGASGDPDTNLSMPKELQADNNEHGRKISG